MQDAIIARFHYFQSTMLPTSMQLNESVLTFSTPKAEKDVVIVRPRQLTHAHVTCALISIQATTQRQPHK